MECWLHHSPSFPLQFEIHWFRWLSEYFFTLKILWFGMIWWLIEILIWRRQWHPTRVLLLGKSHGRRSLVGCSPWGLKESDWLSDFTFTFHFYAWEKNTPVFLPGESQGWGRSHRVGHDWSDLAVAEILINSWSLWNFCEVNEEDMQKMPRKCLLFFSSCNSLHL